MLVLKFINHQLVQVAFATGLPAGSKTLTGSFLSLKNHKQQSVRTLVQSLAQSQKITNVNHQQLIPVARNISFRKCQPLEVRSSGASRGERSSKAPFSVAAPWQFLDGHAHGEPFITTENEHEPTSDESALEAIKRAAKSAHELRRNTRATNSYYGQSFNEALAGSSERRLVVLLSWLEAKEKHIEKYRQFYLERGFDVLNVKTSPWDLLLPNRGARKISEDFVRFMVEKRYADVVLHGFSVGGYMFGRFLLEIDRLDPKMRDQLLESIRGLVFDSLVPIEGVAVGVARSITNNSVGAKSIEQLLRLYLALGHRVATKYYLEASDKVWGGPLKCPTLFLMSKDDRISDYRIVSRLASVWQGKGIECHQMLVESSPHVQLYTKHHEQYVDRVDNFLRHINVGAPAASQH